MRKFTNAKPSLCYFRLAFVILSRFPNCKCRWGARDKFIIWEYTYVSQITHKAFTFCLNYEIYQEPRIWVVEPDLTQLAATELKHVYPQHCNRLCLFHPHDAPWNTRKDIINTIITWAFLWVEFYESWKITGFWYGAEADHTPIQKTHQSNLSRETHQKKHYNKNLPKYLKNHPIRY